MHIVGYLGYVVYNKSNTSWTTFYPNVRPRYTSYTQDLILVAQDIIPRYVPTRPILISWVHLVDYKLTYRVSNLNISWVHSLLPTTCRSFPRYDKMFPTITFFWFPTICPRCTRYTIHVLHDIRFCTPRLKMFPTTSKTCATFWKITRANMQNMSWGTQTCRASVYYGDLLGNTILSRG